MVRMEKLALLFQVYWLIDWFVFDHITDSIYRQKYTGKDGDGPEKPEQEAWGLYAVQAPPVLV